MSEPEFILSEQRAEQGLANFPFDKQTIFKRLDENGTPIVLTDIDVLREVSTWFVRRELAFFGSNLTGLRSVGESFPYTSQQL